MDLTYDLFHISNLFDSSLFFVNHRDSSLSSYLKIEKIQLPELFDQTFFILVFWQVRVKLVECNQGNGFFFFWKSLFIYICMVSTSISYIYHPWSTKRLAFLKGQSWVQSRSLWGKNNLNSEVQLETLRGGLERKI